MSEEVFVGIDVSKNWLDVAATAQLQPRRATNDEPGREELVQQLVKLKPTLVVLEATGGFEATLAAQLSRAGLAVAVINPKKVRDFAKAAGIAAKTDRLDAQVLARFAQQMGPQVHPLAGDQQREIVELVDRRAQLVAMRAQEKTRLSTAQPVARKSVRQHIDWLDAQIKDIDSELHGTIGVPGRRGGCGEGRTSWRGDPKPAPCVGRARQP
ncbi:IS110 family transposase [Caldimonas sp. KR1-144]|uniref:IS110 family transposase n=1 Tax=Caldimonas sp. KR1-144 TaxID=3400911 RepID=UPI003C105CA9